VEGEEHVNIKILADGFGGVVQEKGKLLKRRHRGGGFFLSTTEDISFRVKRS